MSERDPMLTIAEVATRLRLSKMTVYRLVQTGELPALRFGRSFRIETSALTRYCEQAKQAATRGEEDR